MFAIRRFAHRLFGLALLAGCLGAQAARAEPLSFGVLNQQPATETAALWNPILAYVQSKTGIELRFRMGVTVQETDAMSARGEFDFLYSNHIFDPEYAAANYRPLVQWGGQPLVGQIVVAEGSPLRSLKDLTGKKVAFPSKDAFIAYMVTRQALKQAAVDVEVVFGASQQGTAIQLATGRVDAASLSKMFAERFQAEGKGRFRVIYESEPWPNLPVLAHPRIPKQQADAVKKALLEMSTDPDGKAVLDKLKIKGFAPVGDADYAATRRLYREQF